MAELCVLINDGAEFNLDEVDGEPALFYAAKNNIPLVVTRLSDAGLDLNATDDEGKTVLFYANCNNSMDVLCELICQGVDFKLDEIDGKAVLFHAAKNKCKHVVKQLYDAGLDLDITDEQGKTVVFYGNKDFLDALMKVVKVCINARDHYGRTALFYAIQDNDTTKARYLIEKGANLQLKDNCNVSIFTLYVENCILKKEDTVKLFNSELFEKEQHFKDLSLAIFDTLYCQAPLLSVGIPRLIEPYTISKEDNILKALTFIRQNCLFQDANDQDANNQDAIINELIVSMTEKNEIDVPYILSLLIRLGTNPQATDSHGNTALHYATVLPLFGVTQKAVLDICKKVRNFGALLDAKNHQCESPLLFSLSSSIWEVITQDSNWHSSISGFVEVCKFLLGNTKSLQNADTIFHRIISLVQLGLEFNEVSRNAVLQVLIGVLELLHPKEKAVKNVVNYTDTRLNSPLHLWASITLKSPQDYRRSLTGDFTFELILKRILDHLLKCGANVNARNVYDETPLHKCKTWTAVKLLLHANANPNDHNSSGYSPLFAAAKKSNAGRKTGHLYPDVTEDPGSFWKTALEKKLDPWIADNQGETLLSALIKSENFALSRALVEVACNEKSIRDNVKLSMLNVICQDESKHAHWKTDLVEIILNSAGTSCLALESPLRFCCRNIVKFGMFDDELVPAQQKVIEKLCDNDGQPSIKREKKDESEKKEEEKQESKEKQVSNDSVYCKIANQLLKYRVDVRTRGRSGQSCLEIAKDCPSLEGLLTKPTEMDTILIPCASVNHSTTEACELISSGAEFQFHETDETAVFLCPANYDIFTTVTASPNKNFKLDVTDDEGKTAMFYTNQNHSVDTLCRLLDYGAKFKLDEIDGKAVLFHAAKNNYHPTVRELYFAGIDLNITDEEGKTAVFYANQNHSLDTLCTLLDYGAEFKLDEIDGKAVLFHTAKNGYHPTVRELYFAGIDLNITDEEGKTAVFYANQNHSLDTLCTLLDYGAEFELDEIDGKAVLFHAAKNDYHQTVWELYFAGIDLNITDDEGKTAVFYANQNHSMDALCQLIVFWAKFKLDEIDGKAVLFHAAKSNYHQTVNLLYFADIDLNITDDEGKTAVFYANQNHSMDTLCTLLDYGAEFELDEIDGKAVLFHAVENDLPGIATKLYNEGFDLDTAYDEGKTTVFHANHNNSMDVLCELIGCGAEFNLDEIDGKAVLFYAAKYDCIEIATKLHDMGLDLNTTDDESKTAVFHANHNNSMDVLCELIGCGTEFKLDEINGYDVLFYAAENGYEEVVKPLKRSGLDLNKTDKHGKTAAFYGDEDFLNALMEADDISIDARDTYGRTPLFYAVQHDTTKAEYLIEIGANLQSKDNCNVSIFTLFVENRIRTSWSWTNCELTIAKVFQEQQQKALNHAIFDILYCQAALLSISNFWNRTSYAIFNEENVLQALAFARQNYSNQDAHDEVQSIGAIEAMIREKKIDLPSILSLLIKLGASPQATDSRGNTAFHYVTLLPIYGVTQKFVVDICKMFRKFGALLDAKNHEHESPLLFCLSSLKVAIVNNKLQSSISGLVEVCRFLLINARGLQNTESIFSRIISLIQQGFKLNDEAKRKAVVQVSMDILELLQPQEEGVRKVVNYTDTVLNSSLHIWASIELKSTQDYTRSLNGDITFENILKRILDHLLKCGAKLNARNENEETPLHMCRTWTAVKLLLDAGANPNDQNFLGYSPLLTAAYKKYASQKTEHLYLDVSEEAESFWKCAIQKGLDPWIAGKQGETIMSVLLKSEDFTLTRALVEVACKEESTTDNDKLSILNVICQDESKHTHWKTILVDIILKSTRTSRLSLESPLHLCCRNIVKFGMLDDEQPVSVQQKANDNQSYDDGQPPTKKSRKHESEKKEKEKQEIKEEVSNDSVYCKIAKQLRLYGRNVDIAAIVKEYPSLHDFFKETIQIDTVPIAIPWASVSNKRKGILAKVARDYECKTVEQILYHKHHIGRGSFGLIFAGINAKDGREVAVKRIEIKRVERPEYKREINSLIALADSEHVVRYISFLEDDEFYYLVLELMEGNLDEFFDEYPINAAEVTRLCEDVVMGLQFLHEQKILHRDLKPQNILYKVHPKMCLKIGDFGLSRAIDSECTTVYGTIAGTRCWIAPEVLKSKPNSVDKDRFAPESDVFLCGMLLHYILSTQKHPFSPTDCMNKSTLQVSHETEANVMNGKMDGWDNSLCPEATHLIKRMLKGNQKERPSAAEARKHPLFWSNKRKVDFLVVVGNQKEFQYPRSKRHFSSLTQVEKDLEKCFSTIVKHKNWKSSTDMNSIYVGMTRKFRNYNTSSAVELVRFIRNTYEHYRDNTFVTATPIAQMLFDDFVFLKYFPNLVVEVYKPVTNHGWDKTRDDIKCFLNDINTE